MKKAFIIALVTLCSAQVFAQDELSFSVGAAIPTGDFASNVGGTAQTGIMANMLYQHQTNQNSKLWFAGAIRYQSNKIDKSQFERLAPGANVTATNWNAINILIGPVVKFDLSDNASFEPRVLVGYMSATSPKVTIMSGGGSGTLPASTAGAFATMLGANFKFKTSGNASFIIGLDYLTANPKFTLTAGGSSQEANQQINTLNASIGFSFKLD